MKEIYEEPKITLICFDTADVITTSGSNPGETEAPVTSENIGEWDFD